MTVPLALADEVTRRFADLVAVDAVSLRVEGGEVVGLLGANGAGKTTVIRMLLGLLPATEGGVLLFGEPPSRRTRRRLGYVPQTLGLYDDLTVEENLRFAAAAFDTRPPELLGDLAVSRRALVRDLPLGLQRRLAFAQALGHGPDLLVLDEPTSGVDALGRAALWDTIREAAERGTGSLVTTHYMDEAEHCDRLVIMAGGRVVAAGTLREIVGNGRTVSVKATEWTTAYETLDGAGLPVALVGTRLRVPGAQPAVVREALRRANVDAVVGESPATLEETFVALAREAA
jgi:ABC-2 type transport system ATP-binding protein/ribosome-dependent ATPase